MITLKMKMTTLRKRMVTLEMKMTTLRMEMVPGKKK